MIWFLVISIAFLFGFLCSQIHNIPSTEEERDQLKSDNIVRNIPKTKHFCNHKYQTKKELDVDGSITVTRCVKCCKRKY